MKHTALAFLAACPFALADVTVTEKAGAVAIAVDGKLVTEYRFGDAPHVYYYPFIGPGGVKMTRDYPMAKTEGEETDHPHHRSLWFTHGAVNGVDFWTERKDTGTIINDSVKATAAGSVATVVSTNRWVGPNGVVHCTDETTVRLSAVPAGRQIDYEVTLKAPADKAVVLGDTKEGSMAFRVAQWLTPTHMFNKKKQPPLRSLIAEGARVSGDIFYSDGLRVECEIIGNIHHYLTGLLSG